MKHLAPLLSVAGSSVLVLWLAITNVAVAWLAMVVFALASVGGIVWITRRTLRDPFKGLPVPGGEDDSQPGRLRRLLPVLYRADSHS